LCGGVFRDAGKLFAINGYLPAGYVDVMMPGSDGLAFMKKSAKYKSKFDFLGLTIILEKLFDRK